MNTFMHLHVVLPLLLGAPAPEKVQLPKGPPPELQMVMSLDRDKGMLNLVTAQLVAKQGTKTVIENVQVGNRVVPVAKQVPFTYSESVLVEVACKVGDESVSAMDVSGKKLTKGEMWSMLTRGKIIAVSRDRNGLDKAYRAALAPDVIILVMPPPETEK